MAAARNGVTNGAVNGSAAAPGTSTRFSDIPSAIDIPVQGDQEDEAVEIDLEELVDDPTELCTLFENERAAKTYWMTVALAYAKQRKIDHAIEMLIRGGAAIQNNSLNPRDKVSMVCCLCWMYLWKSREAPRVAPEGTRVSDAKTKEYYLQLATSSLNDAARLNPSFPPIFLARGVLLLLRASLQAPSKTAGGMGTEKNELLKTAIKSFDDALRVSQGKNMLALMGKARAFFSMRKYSDALVIYQDVLQKMPDLADPDPRIGIGCCFWQLGFKDDAKVAWDRCLEINPDSKVANILLGLYHLDASGHVPVNSDEFLSLYKKAMTEYTQKSFKLDKDLPLTCATFAGYFLSRKQWENADKLSHKAIQFTDVNAIASDGWYLLARKEHYNGDIERANDYYRRADDARGGTETGYLPAKFGVAQLSVLRNDLGEAKLRLEKIIQQSKNHEAMILLGTLYAEEIFASQNSDSKEDKSADMKKAIALLEGVRNAWKDQKKNLVPDASVLLNLARLYETENPEKALQCLQQVEQLELNQVPASEHPADVTDEAEIRTAIRKFLPPQLLNNIGCFHYQAEKHELASDLFEAALSACIRIDEKDTGVDTDALVSTISFNLGRSYEARGLVDKAVEVYDGLVARHDDYTDARTRLAYIKLRRNPNKEGPDAVAKLYQDNTGDLEVRALYGWYLGKVHSRKRPSNIAEDHEFRHYKHTLQNYDKHDRYALVGMGNLYLMQAREMRRETDHEKQKRSATYSKAVEFFEKALSLDPKNAYAAQGVAIALIEDKKDYKNALPIFHKIRDTIKDSHLYVNLGHIYSELKQFSKAIEHYEIALSKDGKSKDPVILSCLGRTWLNRGRAERDIESYNRALECAQQVLEVAPDQVHYQFNVAFVQIQLNTTLEALPENRRTAEQLEKAAEGLEAAIASLDEIAAHPQTPYPKHDIEGRANMARTLLKKLERAVGTQKEWEEKNKEKIQAAKEQREIELKRREEERQKALDLERERQEKIRKEREAIAARDKLLAEQRAEEKRQREEAEMTTDSETGEKVKRKRKAAPRSTGEDRPKKTPKKKKKQAEDEDEDSEAETRTKKRRRLTKKESTKFKSAELVVDSDAEDDEDELERAERNLDRADTPMSEVDEKIGDDDDMDVDINRDEDERRDDAGEDDDAGPRPQRKRARRGRLVESDEEDEDEDAKANGVSADEDENGDRAAADTSMVEVDEDDE